MRKVDESDRLTALDRLMTEIHIGLEHGERVPCVDRPIAHWWTAEDRERREAAAHACTTCSVLNTCARYVDAHPEPSGVWAGRNRSQPTGKETR